MTTTQQPQLFLPTNELVGVAWLRQRVAGLDASQVATTLPRDPSTWLNGQFLQCTMLSGRNAMIDVPIRVPVFTLDAWATHSTPKSSQAQPPWNAANALMELVYQATLDSVQQFGRGVSLPAAYAPARVQSVYFVTEPTRVVSDPSGYARFTADLAVDWVRP